MIFKCRFQKKRADGRPSRLIFTEEATPRLKLPELKWANCAFPSAKIKKVFSDIALGMPFRKCEPLRKPASAYSCQGPPPLSHFLHLIIRYPLLFGKIQGACLQIDTRNATISISLLAVRYSQHYAPDCRNPNSRNQFFALNPGFEAAFSERRIATSKQ